MAISDQTRPPLKEEPASSSASLADERSPSSAPLRNDWSSLGKWLQAAWRRFTSWIKVDGGYTAQRNSGSGSKKQARLGGSSGGGNEAPAREKEVIHV